MAGAFRNLAQSVLIAVLKSVVMMLLACLATWFLNEGSSRIGTSVSGMLKNNALAACTLSPADITDAFSDVGGLDEIKNDLYSSVVLPLRHADVFYTHHLRHLTPPRGVLFSGPPGTGKSLLARALAKECGVPLIAPTPSMIENKYYGESTKMVANMFQTARALQPCILFVDEIDGMMRNRSEDDQACVYSVKTEFINQMDGTLASAGDRFVVIGATNLPRTLDPALARRMRKVYEFDPPGVDQRRQIISLCKEAADLSEVDVSAVAGMTHGMTGSDVREVIKCASGLRMHRCASDPEFMACVQRSDASAARNYVCALTRADWSRAVEWVRSSMRSRDDPLPPPGSPRRPARPAETHQRTATRTDRQARDLARAVHGALVRRSDDEAREPAATPFPDARFGRGHAEVRGRELPKASRCGGRSGRLFRSPRVGA